MMVVVAPASPMAQATPIVLSFTLWKPGIVASNHTMISDRLLQPVYRFLCSSNFYLVQGMEGGDVCPSSAGAATHTFAHGRYGDKNHNVLQRGEIRSVRDDVIEGVSCTTWEIEFGIVQIGDAFIEQVIMSMNMNANMNAEMENDESVDLDGDTDNGSAEKSMMELLEEKSIEMMTDVVKLAFEVGMMEGTINDIVQAQGLSPVHVTMKGNEVESWKSNGILPTPSIEIIDSLDGKPSLIVSDALLKDHAARYFGIAFFGTILGVLFTLHKLGVCRRRQRGRACREARQQQCQAAPIQFRDEADVDAILRTGRSAMIKKWRDGVERARHVEGMDENDLVVMRCAINGVAPALRRSESTVSQHSAKTQRAGSKTVA